MANRYPLIANAVTRQLEEVKTGDSLNLTQTGIFDGTSTGLAGYVLTSTGSTVSWQAPLSTEQVQDIIGDMVSVNTETNISVTYDDANGKLNFSVPTATTTIAGAVKPDGSTLSVAPDGTLTVIGGGGSNVTNLDSLTDVQIGGVITGQTLRYNGTQFVNANLSYNDLSNRPALATVATSGSYNDLTFRPFIPSLINDLSDVEGTPSVGQVLKWNGTVWAPAADLTGGGSGGGGITLTDLSVTTNAASGGGALTYNNTNGTFTFTPPNLSNFLTTQVNADWNATTGAARILNKPTLAAVATSGSYSDLTNTPTIPAAQVPSDWTATTGATRILNKPTLATVATSGSYNDLTNRPSLATVATTGEYSDLANRPSLASVAISASYNDLVDQPVIPAAQVPSDWNATTGLSRILNKPTLSTVATTGDYFDLANRPTLSTVSATGSYNDLLNRPTLSTVAITGSYNDLTNRPTLVTALSALTDVTLTSPISNQTIRYNGTRWVNVTDNFINRTDLSATNAAASGGGSLSYNNTNGTFTFTPPNLSGYLTGIGSLSIDALSDVSIGTPQVGQTLKWNGSNWSPADSAGGRITAQAATSTIANGAAENITITGFKSYALLKIQTSAAAWVTIYSDTGSRLSDATRLENVDPAPGSGVIAEVIHTSATTTKITPGTIGWNDDATPSTNIYLKVVNKSGSSAAITVTLTLLQLET